MNNIKNFHMPAEWEEHERTFIAWPVKDSLIWSENYDEVCLGYANVAKSIAQFEPVTMIVNEDTLVFAKQLCGDSVDYVTIPHSDAWFRDNGPTFVWNERKQLAGINWKFNAWGEKYTPYELDDDVAPQLLEQLNVPRFDAPLVLEGGSIHVDGEGTLLTTEECLLNPNRNPHLSREKIEEEVKKYLQVSQIIWLKRGLDSDETDGHIDNIACFAAPGKIIIQVCDDPKDPNYEITLENLEILSKITDAKGRKLEIIKIPQAPYREHNGHRLTLSYINFYIVNGGIILPVFGEDAKETDLEAERILQETFPDHKVITIDGMPLIKEGGNIHCITQQMPKGIK